jgi:cytochrome c oxidase subunit III
MSAPEAASVPEGILAHHFSSLGRQNEALRLGMWLFLATEILLFGGLFCGYAVYRYQFHEAFAASSRNLGIWFGTGNTLVLITSSFTVALAIHFARTDRRRAAAICMGLTLAFALTFLVVKGFEYAEHFHERALPGKYYAWERVQVPGAAMFMTLYFSMTGLHGLHVLAGMSVLAWQTWRLLQGRYTSAYYTGLELGGLYWHLVDLIWIFLYPLLYLI